MGSIIKSTAHGGAENLARHVLKTVENEKILLHGHGVSDDAYLAMDEIKSMSLAASKRGTRRPLLHVAISPDRILSDDEWDKARILYEREYGLEGRPYFEVTHTKLRRDGTRQEHKHFVYPSVDLLKGTVVNLSHERPRNEKVAREIESQLGMALTKGRHNRAVEQALLKEGKTSVAIQMREQKLTDGPPAFAKDRASEVQQEKRTDVKKLSVAQDLVNDCRQSASLAEFQLRTTARGRGLFMGEKGPVLLDEGGGVYSLARLINQGAKALDGDEKGSLIAPEVATLGLSPLPAPGRSTKAVASSRKKARQSLQAGIFEAAITVTDLGTAQDTHPGVRHPKRSTWREWRAKVLEERYGETIADSLVRLDASVKWDRLERGLRIKTKDGQEVLDKGDRVQAPHGIQDIPLMIATARGKGWLELEFTGPAEFQLAAAQAALQAGLQINDPALALQARAALQTSLATQKEALIDDVESLTYQHLSGGLPQDGVAQRAADVKQRPDAMSVPEDDPRMLAAYARGRDRANEERTKCAEQAPKPPSLKGKPIRYADVIYHPVPRLQNLQSTGVIIAVDDEHIYVGAQGHGRADYVPWALNRLPNTPPIGTLVRIKPGLKSDSVEVIKGPGHRHDTEKGKGI